MHEQLLAIRTELDGSSDRLSRLAERATDDEWITRPSSESWCASECVQHLNATSRAIVPLIREQLSSSARLAKRTRYRFNFMGWMIWRGSSGRSRMKIKTLDAFVPPGAKPKKEDVVAWAVCQSDVIGALEAGDGFPLGRLKIVSPFDARVRYNVYAAFRILSAHQERHLDQAERAIAAFR